MKKPSTTKKGDTKMGRTIRAKVSKGVIYPLEDLDIPEGKEVTVTVIEARERLEKEDALDKSAGGWVGLVDAEELKKNIYADRLIRTREVPEL